jgi:hypothetical protein
VVEGSDPHPQFYLLWVLLFSLFPVKGFGGQILNFQETRIYGKEKPAQLGRAFLFVGDAKEENWPITGQSGLVDHR